MVGLGAELEFLDYFRALMLTWFESGHWKLKGEVGY